ncbi:hypothetical protein GFD30_18435 [Glycomyces sp. NEAU-7082]|uniref:Uncharacterized protein n=1 Tax=Glycomyces albidus TaxID=2656774 RepID=A0A6L5GD01_9ACTN|nr:hypothetical protein [Glycomyces albidus]
MSSGCGRAPSREPRRGGRRGRRRAHARRRRGGGVPGPAGTRPGRRRPRTGAPSAALDSGPATRFRA